MDNSNNEVTKVLEQYSQEINKEIKEVLSTIEPASLKKASIHLTKAGGKMLRPALTVLVSEAVGGNKKDAIKSAAAIELIHTFSLIHDDIMDQDEVRRGLPSVHKKWGEPVAILAGDTLFSKAFELVINTKVDGTSLGNESFERINQTLATVADACVKICEGQAFDMGFEGNFDVDEDQYIDMIFKKTAALIAAATKAGAVMGGADEKVIKAMYDYGKLIGLAFQIQDDYLDVVSDENAIGKPVGSDIAEGKMTLLVVKSLAEANDEDKKRLIEILKLDDTSPEHVSEAIDIFEKYGSAQYAYDVAMENVENAKQILEILPDSEAKQALSLVADFVVNRQN
ncbi:MAG: short chain isoprenyl diphosphate synthase IdsA [Methanobrevibacter sp.]|nr:short chain isoprenyl diphosphate synthase IdsA [Methanobrevibacter sp.]